MILPPVIRIFFAIEPSSTMKQPLGGLINILQPKADGAKDRSH